MSRGSTLGFSLQVQNVDGTMASSVGDGASGEAGLPAIRGCGSGRGQQGPTGSKNTPARKHRCLLLLDFLVWGPSGKKAAAETRSFIF